MGTIFNILMLHASNAIQLAELAMETNKMNV